MESHLSRKWIWIGVFVLMLAPALVLLMYRVTGDRALQRRLEAIRTHGHPVTLAELDAAYALPQNAENAADLYLDAFDGLVEWDKTVDANLPVAHKIRTLSRTTILPSHTKVLIQQCLAENNETLRLLHEAAALPHCRYPVDLTEGYMANSLWIGELRLAAFLLQMEALNHADSGDVDSAFASLECCMALGRSLQSHLQVEQLNRMAVGQMIDDTFAYVANRNRLSKVQIKRAIQLLGNEDFKGGMTKAIIGERCSGIALFQGAYPEKVFDLVSSGNRSTLAVRLLGISRALGILQRDAISYLDIIETTLACLTLSSLDALSRARELDNVQQASGGYFARQLAGTGTRIVQVTVKYETHRDVTLTGFAVERYRVEHGYLPNNLRELVPAYQEAIATDPYDGQPLRYRRLDPGFVVYSIGINRKDDGGKERSAPTPRRSGEADSDITFVIER